ncbi:hypothetical protein [Mesorhizobium sp. ESP7-2]|uniref:hypothetical protein n=1 Tax=Mesorhizobium sp. ESP7-2 TaxID=2876622 RepID=UPI001CCFCC0A|nr:hypothetical protein [Mesorhizobium sp. ESP7-2]
MHFRAVLAPIHRAELCAELQTPGVYPTYAKNITTAYDDTKAGIADAMTRAVHLRACSSRLTAPIIPASTFSPGSFGVMPSTSIKRTEYGPA